MRTLPTDPACEWGTAQRPRRRANLATLRGGRLPALAPCWGGPACCCPVRPSRSCSARPPPPLCALQGAACPSGADAACPTTCASGRCTTTVSWSASRGPGGYVGGGTTYAWRCSPAHRAAALRFRTAFCCSVAQTLAAALSAFSSSLPSLCCPSERAACAAAAPAVLCSEPLRLLQRRPALLRPLRRAEVPRVLPLHGGGWVWGAPLRLRGWCAAGQWVRHRHAGACAGGAPVAGLRAGPGRGARPMGAARVGTAPAAILCTRSSHLTPLPAPCQAFLTCSRPPPTPAPPCFPLPGVVLLWAERGVHAVAAAGRDAHPQHRVSPAPRCCTVLHFTEVRCTGIAPLAGRAITLVCEGSALVRRAATSQTCWHHCCGA